MARLNSLPPLGNPISKKGILAALSKGVVPTIKRAIEGTTNSEAINSVADALTALGLVTAITPFDPGFVLTNVTDTDGVIEKTAATYAWDAKAQGGPFTGDMSFSFSPTNTGTDAWVGFSTIDTAFANTDPSVNCIYYSSGLSTAAFTNGVAGTDYGSYSSTANDAFRRVGDSLIFSREGVDLHTWTIPATTPLYFVIALAVQNGEVTFDEAIQL